MTYITRNANIVLLFLILISAAALVTATVFFQENFDRLNRAYDLKLNQLNQVTKDLSEKQAVLDQIKNELALKSAREEEFTHQYTEVRTEKTQLEGEKQQLTKTKESLETQLQNARTSLESAQSALEAAQTENTQIKAELSTAQANVAALKKKVDARDATIDCLKSKNDTDENTC